MALDFSETTCGVASPDRPKEATGDLIWIPGGTFRMGSDTHYPEEAPAHRVSVDGFWIDRTPVTNAQFKQFVRATGHVTFAERKPDAEGLPQRVAAHALAGSLVFTPPRHPVDLTGLVAVVEADEGRQLATPLWS